MCAQVHRALPYFQYARADHVVLAHVDYILEDCFHASTTDVWWHDIGCHDGCLYSLLGSLALCRGVYPLKR